MKALFVHDHKFICSVDKQNRKVYSPGSFPRDVWERYLQHFSELKVIGRVNYEQEDKIIDYMESSHDNVSFLFCKSVSSLKGLFFNRRCVVKKLYKEIEAADALIVRLPSELGLLAAKIAHEKGMPYAIEVVGNGWDALWYYGSFIYKLYAFIFNWRNKRAIAKADMVTYVTNEYLQSMYPCSNHVAAISDVIISNRENIVLNRQLSKRLKEKEIVRIGLIGSLASRQKGVDTAIKAMTLVKSRGIKVIFHILGKGNLDNYKELINSLGMHAEIVADGTLPFSEVSNWLDKLDIYIQPSYTEGLPRALIEAMNSALPVLASRIGGMPELLQDECLHTARDYRKLAGDIECIVNDDKFRRDVIKHNCARVKSFDATLLKNKRTVFFGCLAEKALQNKNLSKKKSV